MNGDTPAPPLVPALIRFLRDYAAYAGRNGIAAAVLVLLGALLEGVGLALIAPLLAVLFHSGPGGRWAQSAEAAFRWTGITTLTDRLILLLSLFAAAMILRAVVLLARDVMLARLRVGFIEHQRLAVADALAGAAWDQIVRLRHARVMQVMSADIQQIGNAAYFLSQNVTAVAMLTAQGILALYLSLPLALIVFALLAVSVFALLPTMRRANRLGHMLTNAAQDLLHGTAQFLGGLKLAVSQNLQTAFLAEFRATLQEQSAQQIRYLRQQTESRLAIATLSALVGAVLVLIGLTVLAVPPAMLVTLLLVVTRMNGPAGQIQQGAQMVANALPAYQSARALVGELQRPPAPALPKAAIAPDAAIVFDRVCFSHQDGEAGHGVRDVSVTLLPGTCLGLKGPSGAGKTTFADLLAGLYPPQSGTITLGGAPLTGAVLDAWRDAISYIAQDPFLFHGTIRRNLAWANPAASEAAIRQALALADADGFVRRLPEGLDTVVGERGTLISGGERQRLALARAVLRRPRLLILDEATNAVDPGSETAIVARLMEQVPRPTIIIIAHRPESLHRCDRVLTMTEGCLS